MLDYKSLVKEVREEHLNTVMTRRKYHRCPELGMKEFETTRMIGEDLRALGIEALPLTPTGLMAYIGREDAYTIALRADIDGLMITEEADCDFKSQKEGYMHACGHDAHIAGLLAAAKILKAHEADLSVRVKLIFQPSEENTLGAKQIISEGVLDDVDEVFGLHLFSDLEYGTLSVEEGPRMAQTDRFKLVFKGSGGHAGKPHQCIDATIMAADFAMSSQTIVAREVNPIDSAVVTIGHLSSGTQYNIISESALVEGTCRSFSEEVAAHLKKGIEKRAENIADYYGGSVTIDYDFGAHPPVSNDGALADRIRRAAEKFMDKDLFKRVPKLMLGEDFSWYQVKVPGVFAFVGCGNKEAGIIYPNHHPKFSIDERALEHAALLHLAAVLSAEEKS